MVIAATVLAGCELVPSGPPAGTQFDGVYTGQSTLVSGFGYVCGSPGYPFSVSVKDGRFVYAVFIPPYDTPRVPVQVRADGSLSGQSLYTAQDYSPRGDDVMRTWITLSGHISGSTLDATARDERCARRLTLQRQ
jgi:hypothetical protein